ncbi:hypothetical protein TIFTF001_027925 [Ficus carica]|uniref:Uncharacterized protein n=1 Tax=Ficus carica TaxID=3494 RepID=A0AA88DNX8_FICCA|nr:hypothetical protein TIFTF001_027925 [Ficus carica]
MEISDHPHRHFATGSRKRGDCDCHRIATAMRSHELMSVFVFSLHLQGGTAPSVGVPRLGDEGGPGRLGWDSREVRAERRRKGRDPVAVGGKLRWERKQGWGRTVAIGGR